MDKEQLLRKEVPLTAEDNSQLWKVMSSHSRYSGHEEGFSFYPDRFLYFSSSLVGKIKVANVLQVWAKNIFII